MKSFLDFIERNDYENGISTSDMRVNRPDEYDFEKELNLIHQLQNPKNKDAIVKVLKENPKMAEKLATMIKNALMKHSGIDWYRMSDKTFSGIDKSAEGSAMKMVDKFKQ
jgi:hypothetical protein